MSAKIHVGTSGWHYRHWRGVFYPERLASRDWLGFYASHFDSVEVNRSFYALTASSNRSPICSHQAASISTVGKA